MEWHPVVANSGHHGLDLSRCGRRRLKQDEPLHLLRIVRYMARVARALTHRQRQILVGRLKLFQVRVVCTEQTYEQGGLRLRLAVAVDPHPLSVERGRDTRDGVQAWVGALLP